MEKNIKTKVLRKKKEVIRKRVFKKRKYYKIKKRSICGDNKERRYKENLKLF